MHPALQQAYESLAAELKGMDVECAQKHPNANQQVWCAREVIEHLLATYSTCTAALESRIAKGRPLETKRSLKTRIMQWTVISLGYFPPGRKSPAPVMPGVVRLPALPGAEISNEVRVALDKLDDALKRTAVLYQTQPVVTHFVLGPLSVDQWRKFHRVHARHHAKQLRRLKAGA